MIKCPNCGKQNQDHYKFCLGCGSELPRDATRAPSTTAAPTPPSGIPVAGKQPAAVPAGVKVEPKAAPFAGPSAAAPGQAARLPLSSKPQRTPEPPKTSSRPPTPPPQSMAGAKKPQKCPSCGADVPPDFAFCGRCGSRLTVAPPPPAMAAAPEPVRPEVPIRGKIVMIQPSGAEGISIPLTDLGTEIGRSSGEAFKDDYFLSPKHARFTIEKDKLFVEDLGSLNGIYIRLLPESPYDIQSGDFVRIGQEVVKFELLPEPPKQDTPIFGSPRKESWGKIALVLGKDKIGNAFTIEGKEVLVGRERGNIVFPDDGYVSGLHMKISRESAKITVTDLKSSNGSYLKIREKKECRGGDYLLIGQFLYRVDF